MGESISRAQCRVMGALSRGWTRSEIAIVYGMTGRDVRVLIASVLEKTETRTVLQALAVCIRRGEV